MASVRDKLKEELGKHREEQGDGEEHVNNEAGDTSSASGDYVTEREQLMAHYYSFKEFDEPERFYPGKRFNPELMLFELKEDGFATLALPTEKKIRLYENGVYRIDDSNILGKEIAKKLDLRAKPVHLNESLTLLREKCMVKLNLTGVFPFRHIDEINLMNGYIDVNTGKFTEHCISNNFKSLIQIPVVYDEQAECPNIDEFLSDKLKGRPDLIRLAHEIVGISMLQYLPFDNVFVLLGPSHTGKSTFLHLISRFLGGNNISATTLQQLNDEKIRFARAGLYGKLANISSDLSAKYFTQDSIVKAISQGDTIEVEFKGIDRFRIIPFANLIAACNEMPKSRDQSNAWLNRLTILPWDVAHTSEDKQIIERLTTPNELSGLFNKAFQALQQALQRNALTLPGEVKEERERYRRNNNQVVEFFELHYEKSDDLESYVLENDMYDRYKDWCQEEEIEHLNKTKFRKAICQILNIKDVHRLTISGERPKGYRQVVESNGYDYDNTDDNEIKF